MLKSIKVNVCINIHVHFFFKKIIKKIFMCIYLEGRKRDVISKAMVGRCEHLIMSPLDI